MKNKVKIVCDYCGGGMVEEDVDETEIVVVPNRNQVDLQLRGHAGDSRRVCSDCWIKVFDKILK